MQLNDYKPRLVDEKLKQYLDVFGAVSVEGPKWCGKTWTSLRHSNSSVFIGDPDSQFQNRRLAEISPSAVLDGSTPRLIDEWQEVPSIWDAVRHKVDQTTKKGQFILTGSATPKRKGILHSGAGRIAKLRMRPMSLFESGDSSGIVSLQNLFDGTIEPKMTGDVNLVQLTKLIIRGGWPGSLGFSLKEAKLLPMEYLNAVLDDDVNRIDGIKRDSGKLMLLLQSLARNESTTVSNRTLLRDIKNVDDQVIDSNTVADYLDVFNRLFFTDNLRPFSTNIRSSTRIKQLEKRQFVDPSLAAALLKATPDKLINDLNTLGFLFESLCARDLKIYADAINADIYHYQDYKNREIDVVIEASDGRWAAIEIKLGANEIDSASEKLISLKHALDKESNNSPSVLCVICGMSNATYQREDGVFVVPITALKP